ncbi:uncharacterized protein LOC116346626, partial [Contarinia nasturtii]|uniref:uncharacterized protein LOC116346626 n=1 Tax=Contarinia nasturtii TaxID=265458 RepID=UPI0012D4256A
LGPTEAIKASTEYVCSKLSQSTTKYKRNKLHKRDEFYVEPELKGIGTRFEIQKPNALQPALPVRLQCTFPYISILQSLKCAFKNKSFLETYLEYNKHGNGHTCKEGDYIDFCCGSVYKSRSIFQKFPNSLQIQIFLDDFEPCNPLGSKATLHKICGVYFSVRNMPQNSKLSSIYLIALCNSDDLKTKSTDYNNLLRLIVEDLKVLEVDGINVSSDLNLKGTLGVFSADNLGANGAFGFVESFGSANIHFCKICELPKYRCQTACKEDISAMRTIKNYEVHLETISNSTKVNLEQTKGIKRDCDLNKLKYFHTMENYCIDQMHDVAEGIVPFVLHQVFQYIIEKKICTEISLTHKIQFYDYGIIESKNVPSMIMLSKPNLNQNAAQSMCLFKNIPYILSGLKEKLNEIWICVTSLQKIIQTIESDKIHESDLILLESNIHDHLESLQNIFGVKLIPKHHNLVHYPRVIRAMGSVKNMSTIRFEAKHQVFKSISRQNKNFKKLTYTLAMKHQKLIAKKMKTFSNILEVSSSKGKVISSDQLPINIMKDSAFEIKRLTI